MSEYGEGESGGRWGLAQRAAFYPLVFLSTKNLAGKAAAALLRKPPGLPKSRTSGQEPAAVCSSLTGQSRRRCGTKTKKFERYCVYDIIH